MAKQLIIGDGGEWSFLNGAWVDGPDGELTPPDGPLGEYMAVQHAHSYEDFTARFRFKFRCCGGGARLLFHVQDSRRFYALDVPINGQQARSRHFWAGLVMADGSGLQRYLTFGLVPGLCCRLEHWYDARVESKGSRLRAWINDIPVADVEDSTYAAGAIGVASLSNPYSINHHFAALAVEGGRSRARIGPPSRPQNPTGSPPRRTPSIRTASRATRTSYRARPATCCCT